MRSRCSFSGDTPAARREAIDKFRQSLVLWQGAKDQANEAWALYILAYTLNVNGDYQKAFETAEQGLRVARSAGVPATEAYLLDEVGRSYNNRGERSKALEFFKQALALRLKQIPRASPIRSVISVRRTRGSETAQKD